MSKAGRIKSKTPSSAFGAYVSQRRGNDGKVTKGYGGNAKRAHEDRERKERKNKR